MCLFREELERLRDAGALSELRVCFSRDAQREPGDPRYVQDNIVKHAGAKTLSAWRRLFVVLYSLCLCFCLRMKKNSRGPQCQQMWQVWRGFRCCHLLGISFHLSAIVAHIFTRRL